MFDNYNKYFFKVKFLGVVSEIEFDTINRSIFYQRGPVKHFYHFKDILYYRLFNYHDYDLLCVSYENEFSKKKLFRLYADKKDVAIQKFLALLVQTYPSGDLSHLTPKEARSFLGLKHPYFWPLVVLNIFFFLLLLLIYKQVVLNDAELIKQKSMFGMIFLGIYLLVFIPSTLIVVYKIIKKS